MEIRIVGSGQIGKLCSQAVHEVLFSSRHPQKLGELVKQAGGAARAGTPEEAIAFGGVVLLSKPISALLDFGRSMTEALGRKVMLGTATPPGPTGTAQWQRQCGNHAAEPGPICGSGFRACRSCAPSTAAGIALSRQRHKPWNEEQRDE